MNIDIRKSIINNFKGDNYETLKRAIEESIANYDENVLYYIPPVEYDILREVY